MPDDYVLVRQFGKAVLRATVGRVLRGRLGALSVLGRLGMGRLAIQRAKKGYYDGEVNLAELYEVVNRYIIREAPLSLISRTTAT